MDIDQLNEEFGIPGHLAFIKGDGGLTQAHIKNKHGKAVVSTYSGQVLSYIPADQNNDLLFVSEAAYFQQGKATKGGIPVCWPWFGPDPENKGRSAHGFVRNRQWQVINTAETDNETTQLLLGINSDKETLGIWPHAFELRIEVTVGPTLKIKLITTNSGQQAFTITQALHTYFNVGEVTRVQVTGLEQKNYIDKLDEMTVKTQAGAVRINEAVDRIYMDTENPVSIEDPVLQRQIQINTSGSKTAVVWNPWIKQSAEMSDFRDDEYHKMLCVETANAGPEQITLAPGETHQLVAEYSFGTTE